MTRRFFLLMLAAAPPSLYALDLLPSQFFKSPLLGLANRPQNDLSCYQSLIQNDFESERIQIVDGWILSETESQILASGSLVVT